MTYLAEEVGLGRDGAAEVITTYPDLLGLSVEKNIAHTVKFLEEEGVPFLVEEDGAGREGAADIILKIPSLLGLDVERTLQQNLRNLQKSKTFYNAHGPAARLEIANQFIAMPIVARLRLLESIGQAGTFAAFNIIELTDKAFCKRVGVQEKQYDAELSAYFTKHRERRSAIRQLSQHEIDAKVRKLWRKQSYRDLNDLTLAEAAESRKFCIYFGTTYRECGVEFLRWLITPSRGKSKRLPRLVWPDGTLITKKPAKSLLGFVWVEMGAYKLNKNACGVEAGLQQMLEDHPPGVKLHRVVGAGTDQEREHFDRDKHSYRVFMTVARITHHRFHLGDWDARRRVMEINGYEVHIIL